MSKQQTFPGIAPKRPRKLGLLGKKLGMTQVFDAQGEAHGVTVLELGPCRVMGIKTQAKDGYSAIVLGFGAKRADKVNAPQAGQLRASGLQTKQAAIFTQEIRVTAENATRFKVGQEVTLKDLNLKTGDLIDVTGTSKGKGFQGVMKRHHFSGFRATHGTHEYFRHGGSIGCRKWPGRVFKGRKMPGHMGDVRVTIQNLEIVQVRDADNVLLVNGAVPGAKNGYLMVRPAIKHHPELG